MGEVERYPNGTFCWVDLETNDAAGAKAFYGGLLGWEFDDLPTGEKGTYSTCRLRGRAVAGLYDRAETPGWGSYISIDDVDRATGRARKLGAEVLVEPFGTPGGGRVAAGRDFYVELLGWSAQDATPRWSIAFWVADADQAAARAEELGGTVLLPPMDIPVGRFTVLTDPQGASFTASAVPGGPTRGVDGS